MLFIGVLIFIISWLLVYSHILLHRIPIVLAANVVVIYGVHNKIKLISCYSWSVRSTISIVLIVEMAHLPKRGSQTQVQAVLAYLSNVSSFGVWWRYTLRGMVVVGSSRLFQRSEHIRSFNRLLTIQRSKIILNDKSVPQSIKYTSCTRPGLKLYFFYW